MDVESYSGYVISVQACNSPNNSPKLCSAFSESISVKTQIGGPYISKNIYSQVELVSKVANLF